MKKLLSLLFVFALMISLSACGNTNTSGEVVTDVTWQELIAANAADRIFEQTSSYLIKTESDEELYQEYYAMVDGEFTHVYGYGNDTVELINGIEYDAPEDGYQSITIIAPGANMIDFYSYDYKFEFEGYTIDEKVYKDGDTYYVNLKFDEPEYGYSVASVAYFHAESFLLDRIENTLNIADTEVQFNQVYEYDVEDIPFNSFDRVTNSEDTVDLTIHYPDGSTKDITVGRDVTIVAYYPDYIEEWSVCRDEACTESIFDLSWVDGDHADLYLCEGYVTPAAPDIDYVLENSTFDAIFNREYNTYTEETYVEDEDHNIVAHIELGYYVDEETGLNLNYEVQNENFELLRSNKGRDGAWYGWNFEDGYYVDFYNDFSYVKELMADYIQKIIVPENPELLYDEDSTYYYIPNSLDTEDGTKDIKYWISSLNYIERVEETYINHDNEIYAYVTTYIGGNGPNVGSFDIYGEMSNPSDGTDTVELTVVSSNGEKTYSIRTDATITYEGDALFSDEACTTIVTDLTWVEGGQATVYTQK